MLRRAALLAQVPATVLILGFVPGNALKLALMLLVWALGFRGLSRREGLMVIGVNALFFAMNSGALRQGVFRFSHPDLLGMPVYEFFMWGFYTLNATRLLGGAAPVKRRGWAVALAVLFAVPFSTVTDDTWLLATTGAVLVVALLFFHEREDLAFTGYLVVMGALIEYVGVWTGQWSYPAHPLGGVPLWFITMWGGGGLFTRRLRVPLLLSPSPRGESEG